MNTEAQTILESLEADVDRMRIDPALKASMLARLDRLMAIVGEKHE